MANLFDDIPIPSADNTKLPTESKGIASYLPMPVRNVARGILSIPVDAARLAGYFGADYIGRLGQTGHELLNEYVAPEARLSGDTFGALTQIIAPALIPGPGGAVIKAVQGMKPGIGKAALLGTTRLVEAALPGSGPYTAGNVALNAGMAVGINKATEELFDAAYPEDKQSVKPPSERGVASGRTTPVTPVTRNLFDDILPNSGNLFDGIELPATMVPSPPSSDPVTGNPIAKAVADKLPWIIGGLSLLSVGAAARSGLRAGNVADAANVGGLTQPGTPRSPAPDVAISEMAEAGIFNNLEPINNRAKQAVRDGTFTPEQAEHTTNLAFINARETINNDRFQEIFDTGMFDNNYRTHAPRVIAEDAARLTPDQQRLLNDLLPAADEMRERNWSKRTIFDPKTGETKKGQYTRTALADKDDEALSAAIAAGRADPQVAALEQRINDVYSTMLNYMQSRGVFSADDVKNIRSKGLGYQHRMIVDLVTERNRGAGMPLVQGTESDSPVTKRSGTEGSGPLRYQDPIVSLEDAMRQSIEFANRNEVVRELAKLSISRGNTPIPGINRVIPGNAEPAKGWTGIAFRDDKGGRYRLEVDRNLAAALMPYPRATIPVLNGLRIFEQQMTTGLPGLILGNIQAPISATMGGMTAAITTPSKLRVGYVDTVIRAMTGDRINIRKLGLVDPTFVAQAGIAALRGFADDAANSLGSVLRRSAASNGWLANAIGTDRAARTADRMLAHYRESLTSEMRRMGVMSRGIAYSNDAAPLPSNIANAAPEYARRIPYGGNAASLFDIRSEQQLREYLAVKGARVIPVNVRRTWNLLSRTLDMISNAPQMAIYRANRKYVDPTKLSGMARLSVGDPAQYGGFKVVQAGTSASTYLNIAMQAAHQVFKAAQREPLSVAGRMATLGTMISLAMLYSATLADEDAIVRGEEPTNVAHMMTRDAMEAARAFRFYLPGVDPEQSIRIPIDGALAPFFSAILGGLTEAFDVANPDYYTGRYAPLRDSIGRMLEDINEDRNRAALGYMGLDISMPGLLRTLAEFGGSNIRNAMNFATSPLQVTKLQDAPGFAQTQLNNDVVDRYTGSVISNMGGLGGVTFLELMRTLGYTFRINNSIDEAFGATAKHYGIIQGTSGSSRIAAPLFDAERRMRVNDIIGENVRKLEQKLGEISSNSSQIGVPEGTIGSKRRLQMSPYEAGREKMPTDIVPVVDAFRDLYNKLRPLRDERTREGDYMRDANSSSLLRSDPAKLRTVINQHVENIRSRNAEIYGHIDMMERQLSIQTGRRIRLDRLDSLRGLDQFAPIH